jgi:hypothetical protein
VIRSPSTVIELTEAQTLADFEKFIFERKANTAKREKHKRHSETEDPAE